MRPTWDDVNARARGLGTRLLAPEVLAGLSQIHGLGALARALAARGLIPEESAAGDATELGLALRRMAAREIALLRRWLGPRDIALAIALDAEDRRSLRALTRGAAEGAAAETRLAGLVPTPTLPERLLSDLAGRASIREQGVLLVAAGHPCGTAVLRAASDREPDLFRIELAIARTLAERAVRGCRGAGRFLRDYVAGTIDRDNCRTALALAAVALEEPAAPLYLPGGDLRREEFERAAGTGDPVEAARVLGRGRSTRELALILLRHAASPADLERALEDHAVAAVQREARLDPLGPAPTLLFLHRLRRQSIALARLLWSADLGVPTALVAGVELR
ncbi:MAG TPA: V-type ATPase subunit [Gemmatimonadales bacterium]